MPSRSFHTTAMHVPRRRVLAAGAALAGGLAGLQAEAAADSSDWPARPVRFIVPFPPRHPVDAAMEILAPALGKLWQCQTRTENRVGADGMAGAAEAAKEAGDGHTLFVGSIRHAIHPALRAQMGARMEYDIERDFVAVSTLARFPLCLVIHPSLSSVWNMHELVALAKEKGDAIRFGSPGEGSLEHLAGELFNMQAGTKMRHVPCEGNVPAIKALLAGEVQLMFADVYGVLPHLRSGKLGALAIASRHGAGLLANVFSMSLSSMVRPRDGVPRMAEMGVDLSSYEASAWAALFAPAGTPQALVEKINADVLSVINQSKVWRGLVDVGIEPDPDTPQRTQAMLREELEKWAQVVKTANIRAV